MSDMTVDIFAEEPYGKAALKKLNKLRKVHANFRLYSAGFVGDNDDTSTMCIKGAQFRVAKRGPNKGKLCIMVPDTIRTVYVTSKECEKFK